jgi:hypothetical protein
MDRSCLLINKVFKTAGPTHTREVSRLNDLLLVSQQGLRSFVSYVSGYLADSTVTDNTKQIAIYNS